MAWTGCRLGLSPVLLPGRGSDNIQQSPGTGHCFCCRLAEPIWKAKNEPCLFLFAFLPQQSNSPGNVHPLALSGGKITCKGVRVQYFNVLSRCTEQLHIQKYIISQEAVEKVSKQFGRRKFKTGKWLYFYGNKVENL